MSSDGGVAAMDGAAAVRGVGTDALRTSEIPPWAAIDNKTNDTQKLMVFIAPPSRHIIAARGRDVRTPPTLRQIVPVTSITTNTTASSPTTPLGP